MTNNQHDTSLRNAAIIAGFGFLLSLAGAIFSSTLPQNLIVPDDAALTASNLLDSAGLYRAGILSWLLVILGDLVRAWALFVILKQVNRSLALLSAWFMLIHDAILGVSLISLTQVPMLAGGTDFLMAFSPDQLHTQILLNINRFDLGFLIGLFFFSFHLALVGLLVLRSGFIPKIFSALLFIAAGGYFLNSAGKLLNPDLPQIIWNILAGPNLIGELAIVAWLFIKGVRNTLNPGNLVVP